MSARAGLGVRVLLVALALLPAATTSAQTTAAITAADLRQRLFIFADDSMLGRATGARGNVKATEYLVRELTRLRLRPSGDGTSFYQNVPIERVKVDLGSAELEVNGFKFKAGLDFLPIVGHFGAAFAIEASELLRQRVVLRRSLGDNVFADTALGLPKAVDAKGQVVKPDETWSPRPLIVMKPAVRSDNHPDYQLWNAPAQVEQYRGAAGLLVETLDITPRSVRALLAGEGMRLRPAEPVVKDSRPPPPPIAAVVAVTPNLASVLKVDTAGEAFLRFHSSVRAPAAPTRNVVAMIEGSEPGRLRAEVVVLSAHSDHLGVATPDLREGRDSIMNGADVGGSGAVALLEIAEYMAALHERPKRSIMFLWTVGEEQGMLGAQWFVSKWFGPQRDASLGTVIANINVDAVGRGLAGDIKGGGPDYVQMVSATGLSSEYENWLYAMINKPAFQFHPDIRFGSGGKSARAACTGDHWIFARAGVPSVLITTGNHADARAVTDAPATVDYEKLAKVTRFVAALAIEVANRDERPALADSVASPRAPCGA